MIIVLDKFISKPVS